MKFSETLIAGSGPCKSGSPTIVANISPSLGLSEKPAPAGLCWEESEEMEEYPGEQEEDRS